MSSNVGPDRYMLYPLAKWAAGLQYEDIPEAIAHQARMSLLDTIGCVIAGFSNPDNQNILRSPLLFVPCRFHDFLSAPATESHSRSGAPGICSSSDPEFQAIATKARTAD